LLVLAKATHQSLQDSGRNRGLAIVLGYFEAALRGSEKERDKEITQYFRRTRLRELLKEIMM
jgi:hypothetical protein